MLNWVTTILTVGDIAFSKTGVPKEQFTVTKWGVDKYGKSFPTEYRVLEGKNRGAEVNIGVSIEFGPYCTLRNYVEL